jgi:hypothetical protein
LGFKNDIGVLGIPIGRRPRHGRVDGIARGNPSPWAEREPRANATIAIPTATNPATRFMVGIRRRELSWHFSSRLHQRGGTLADFLKRRFETSKLILAQLREHSPHLPDMLSEGWNNQVLAARCEGDDPNAPVFGALGPAN